MVRSLWLLPVVFLVGGSLTAEAGPCPTRDTVIRVARSSDGLSWADAGEVFVIGGAAPDLIRTPDGDLLALVDYATGGGGGKVTVMAVARSTDDGQSWSPLRPIKLTGRRTRPVLGHHGDLVVDSDGQIRLHFADPGRKSRSRRSASAGRVAVIRSAVSRDGLEYRLDDRARVTLRGALRRGRFADVHPTVGRIGSRVHLFGHSLAVGAGDHTQHLLSSDGRRFTRLKPVRIPEVSFVGSIVPVGEGVRAYASGEGGVRSLVSKDGCEWTLEEGVHIRNGWDPAVVKLGDGSFLMLYCTETANESAASSQLIVASAELLAGRYSADNILGVDEGSEDGDGPADGDVAGGGKTGGDGDTPGGGDVTADDSLADGSSQEVAEETGDGQASADAETTGLEDLSPVLPEMDEDGFVSLPDFRRKVNYFQWFCDELLGKPEDNAYYAYDKFMHNWRDEPGGKPEWPKLNDMFNSGEYDGPPGPWDPAEHPEWETTHHAVQDLLAQFREATRHEAYAQALDEDYLARVATPDGDLMLMNLILPSLSSHRAMVKATMADAWRAEDGKVSSERMLEAWETILRNANHLNQGPTLIEELVSVAERALTQRNARWALKHNVFSGDELEGALEVLTEYDRGNRDPMFSMRGEHAFSMDMVQALYWPSEPGGEPTFNADHAPQWFEFNDETIERLRDVGAEDVRETIRQIDIYHRELGELMSIGYPEARASDLDAVAEKHIPTNPITDFLLPSLSRVHTLRTRLEASRRATQLAYATRLFKHRNGRWPESLGELDADFGPEMLTDPFTGDHFGYRLTDEGPRIYSLSENARDDGGVHSRRWNDEIENDADSDDYVFWPPQHR